MKILILGDNKNALASEILQRLASTCDLDFADFKALFKSDPLPSAAGSASLILLDLSNGSPEKAIPQNDRPEELFSHDCDSLRENDWAKMLARLQKTAKQEKSGLLLILPYPLKTCRFWQLIEVLKPDFVFQTPPSFELLSATFNNLLSRDKQQTPRSSNSGSEDGNPVDIDAIEAEIRALSIEYINELPERIEKLSADIHELKQGRLDIFPVKNEAHKIKGTAASYGLPEVGEQAAIIDACLKQLMQAPEADPAETWLKIADALKQAQKLADLALSRTRSGESPRADITPKMEGKKEANRQFRTLAAFSDQNQENEFAINLEKLAAEFKEIALFRFADLELAGQIIDYLNPDCVLIDTHSPETGLSFCQSLKSSANRDAFELILTCKPDHESRMFTHEAGADDYVLKPIIYEELLTRLNIRRLKKTKEKES